MAVLIGLDVGTTGVRIECYTVEGEVFENKAGSEVARRAGEEGALLRDKFLSSLNYNTIV